MLSIEREKEILRESKKLLQLQTTTTTIIIKPVLFFLNKNQGPESPGYFLSLFPISPLTMMMMMMVLMGQQLYNCTISKKKRETNVHCDSGMME